MSTTTAPTRTVSGRLVPATGSWVIDPGHTSAEFVARHLMVTKVRGGFRDISGTIIVAEDPAASKVEVTMQAASVFSGTDDRDAHIRSADFLDVENYPTLEFASTTVEPARDGWKIHGELTIRGTVRSVVLDMEFLGVTSDPWGNAKAAFQASTEINREDWGLTWNVPLDSGGVLVSKNVKIQIEAQAALQA